MANTTSFNATLTWSNGSGSTLSAGGSTSVTQSGTNAIANVQNIGTSTEALTFGDVTTIGYLFVKNTDSTNYVEFDLNTPVAGTAFAKLLPGEFMFIPTRQTTIYGKANTAACDCLVELIEL